MDLIFDVVLLAIEIKQKQKIYHLTNSNRKRKPNKKKRRVRESWVCEIWSLCVLIWITMRWRQTIVVCTVQKQQISLVVGSRRKRRIKKRILNVISFCVCVWLFFASLLHFEYEVSVGNRSNIEDHLQASHELIMWIILLCSSFFLFYFFFARCYCCSKGNFNIDSVQHQRHSHLFA